MSIFNQLLRDSLKIPNKPSAPDVSRVGLRIPSHRMVKAYIQSRLKDRYSGAKTFDPRVRAQILGKTGGHCYLCHRKYSPDKAKKLPKLYFEFLEIDHVVPVDAFGPNSTVNYLPACRQCNKAKSNLSLAEYRNGWRRRRDGSLYRICETNSQR